MNALMAQRYEVRIGMVELFWGLIWRTSLSGLVFGAVLGGSLRNGIAYPIRHGSPWPPWCAPRDLRWRYRGLGPGCALQSAPLYYNPSLLLPCTR